MEEIINLYLVKTRGFKAYVVGKDPNSAIEKFKRYLDDRDYGYYWDRDFQSIELVASTSKGPKTATGTAFDDSRTDDLLLINSL